MSVDAGSRDGWTSSEGGRPNTVRVLVSVVFVVLAVFAFAQFFSGLEARGEVVGLATTGIDAHVYWVFAGVWVPLGVLLAAITTMAVWATVQDGFVHRTGLRRIGYAGLACAGFCLLGVLGVAVSAPGPFLALGWSALVALALTLLACGVQALAGYLLTPPEIRRPAGTALR